MKLKSLAWALGACSLWTALPAQAQEIRALLSDAGFAEKPTGFPNGRNRLFCFRPFRFYSDFSAPFCCE